MKFTLLTKPKPADRQPPHEKVEKLMERKQNANTRLPKLSTNNRSDSHNIT